MIGSMRRGGAAKADAFYIDDLLRELDDIRGLIQHMRTSRALAACAPRPLAETLAAFDAWLDVRSAEAIDRLNIHYLIERMHNGALELPVLVGEDRALSLGPAVDQLFALFLMVNRHRLREVIAQQLEKLMLGRNPLTDAEQREKLADLDREILAGERSEEITIRKLERAGVEIARRPDASPLAVLAADTDLPEI